MLFIFFSTQGVSSKILVEIVLLDKGKAPKQATEFSAGFDMYAYEDAVLLPGRCSISLGFKCAIPKAYYGQLKRRSGLALWNHVTVDAGTVDSDYRGIVYILLVNHSDRGHFVCEKGMRIGQMIFCKCESPEFRIVNKLSETKRNTGGFGYTGLWKVLRKKHEPNNEQVVVICCRHLNNFFIETNGLSTNLTCNFFCKKIELFE